MGQNPAAMLIDELYEANCRKKSDIHEHLPTLKRYGSECATIVEMGVRKGVSTSAWLAARPKKVRSYDIDGDFFLKHRDATYRRAAAEVGADFEYIVADVLTLDIEETDLLFIDTWHVYDQLKKELDRHAGKAKKYIVLHDTETFGTYGEDPEWKRAAHRVSRALRRISKRIPEVKRLGGLVQAVDEFLAAHPEWKRHEHFANNNGLTVLARK